MVGFSNYLFLGAWVPCDGTVTWDAEVEPLLEPEAGLLVVVLGALVVTGLAWDVVEVPLVATLG